MSRRTLLVSGLLFAAAHILLFLPLPAAWQPHLVQAAAALILGGFLPGFLLVHVLVGQGEAAPPWWEHAVLGAGAAYVVLVGGMLLLSYLPGGPTLPATLALFDALTLGLGAWVIWRNKRRPLPADARPFRDAFLYGGVILVLLFRPQGLFAPVGAKPRV